MADPDQPKKETVRIQLPSRETGSDLPTHASPQYRADAPAEDFSSTHFFPSPRPTLASTPLSASVRPAPGSPAPGPKRETVGVPLMSEPLRSVAVAPTEKSSMVLYWILLGVSALILIIQIWTYFS
jgi:hypothetical protein